ncbi:MAG TPA: hypothetical protein VK901_12235 [Nitrospiraceae bacterium]|nr:hypothetical protein [Nitrospiraceae bacterium]
MATKLLPRVLLVEFDEAHTPMDGEDGTRIKHHIELLEHAGMRCIAVDGCNASFTCVLGDPDVAHQALLSGLGYASQEPVSAIVDTIDDRLAGGRPILCNLGCSPRH